MLLCQIFVRQYFKTITIIFPMPGKWWVMNAFLDATTFIKTHLICGKSEIGIADRNMISLESLHCRFLWCVQRKKTPKSLRLTKVFIIFRGHLMSELLTAFDHIHVSLVLKQCESCCNTNAIKIFQSCCCFTPDDACAITNRMLCVPEVYGPTLSGNHVVLEALFSTAVNHQW